MAFLEGTRRAGGTRAQADAELVEKDEGALVVDPVERDGDESGEAEGRLRGSEHTHALDAGKSTNKSLAQRFYLRRIGFKPVACLVERGCHAGGSRDV